MYASASEGFRHRRNNLAGGMLVRYTNVSEAKDITMRLDILRRKMFIPIKVVSRDEFRIIMDTPNGLDYYSAQEQTASSYQTCRFTIACLWL